MPAGSKPGERRGGRRAGTRNKRTIRKDEEMRAAMQRVVSAIPKQHRFEGGAVELLTAVYKDMRNPMTVRIEAAVKAAPYESPKLQSVSVVGQPDGPADKETVVHKLTEDIDLIRKIIT